jgi:hypothetical protein
MIFYGTIEENSSEWFVRFFRVQAMFGIDLRKGPFGLLRMRSTSYPDDHPVLLYIRSLLVRATAKVSGWPTIRGSIEA